MRMSSSDAAATFATMGAWLVLAACICSAISPRCVQPRMPGVWPDRDGHAGFAPSAEEGEAIDARKTEIEQDSVIALRTDGKVSALTVCRRVDRVARPVKGASELFA